MASLGRAGEKCANDENAASPNFQKNLRGWCFTVNASRAALLLLTLQLSALGPACSERSATTCPGRGDLQAALGPLRCAHTPGTPPAHVTREGQWAGRPREGSYKGACRSRLTAAIGARASGDGWWRTEEKPLPAPFHLVQAQGDDQTGSFLHDVRACAGSPVLGPR